MTVSIREDFVTFSLTYPDVLQIKDQKCSQCPDGTCNIVFGE
jgi:hypothetical protein